MALLAFGLFVAMIAAHTVALAYAGAKRDGVSPLKRDFWL